MKVINFIVGMIVGMVLLVVAVCGTIVAAGSLVSVGQLENTLGTDIFEDESDVVNKTLLEVAKDLIGDLKNLDGLTINTLKTKYGLKIPSEISGIDISVLFDYPVTQVADHLGDVVNNMTLRDVGEFLNMDFENDYNIPVLTDNLDNHVNVALDNILKSIDGEKLTLAQIEANFNISFGDNAVLSALYHAPLSSFGELIDSLPLRTVIGVDSDLFVKTGANEVYVDLSQQSVYEAVSETEFALVKDGAETYIAGAKDGAPVYKELRYVRNDDGTYSVNNASNADGFTANDTVYYRRLLFKPYSGTEGAGATYCVPAYYNAFALAQNGSYAPVSAGFVSLKTLYTAADASSSYNDTVSGSVVTIGETFVKNGEAAFAAATPFGVDSSVLPAADTRLQEGFAGYLRVYEGTSDGAVQAIADCSVSALNNATSQITGLSIGEIIDIDSSSAKILQKLKDTPVRDLSAALDSLVLADVTDINMSTYVVSENGAYVYVPSPAAFVPYDAADPSHAGATRYSFDYVSSADGDYVLFDGRYYRYSASDSRFDGCPRYERRFFRVTTSSPALRGEFVSEGGYYTLYTPAFSDPVIDLSVRYDRIYDASKDSPAALQRLAFVAVPDISAQFANMVLADTMTVDLDVFGKISLGTAFDAAETYYVFDGFYRRADAVNAENFDSYVVDGLYTRISEGASNSVIKQLAYVTIDGVPAAMDDIINDMLLSDIIDVVAITSVREEALSPDAVFSETDASRWLFEKNPYFTESSADGTVRHYTYVYDGNGKYYRTDELFSEVQPGQVVKLHDGAFSYAAIDDVNSVFTVSSSGVEYSDNVYFLSADGEYFTNPALLSYYAVKYGNDILSHVDLYSRVAGSDVAYTAYENNVSATGSGLYVKIFGQYVRYDSDNLVHANEQLYFKYTDGYYPASADTAGLQSYFFDFTSATFSSSPSASSFKYVMLPGTEKWYYSRIDSAYTQGTPKFSKRECEEILLSDGTSVTGYVGNNAANMLLGADGAFNKSTMLTQTLVSVIEEKSPVVLTSLLSKKVTVGNMSEKLNALTLEELIDIEDGSILSDESIRTAKIDEISMRLSSLFSDMTIGELILYTNISVNGDVAFILNDFSLQDFFSALEFDASVGSVTVNLGKLYGLE